MGCVKCKKEIPDGALYCPWCGKKQVQEKRKALKRANGTGSVYKLSQPRLRRPWVAWKSGKVIGYYETKTEAMDALDLFRGKEVPDRYNETIDSIYKTLIKEKNVPSYETFWKHLEPLHGMKMKDIRSRDYQAIIDGLVSSGKKKATCKKVKTLMLQINKIALRDDVIDKDYSSFVVLPDDDSKTRRIFTDSEIKTLFQNENNPTVKIVLILIYTGMRIGELFDAEKANVHIDEGYLIGGSKTDAGRNRVIPINDKIKKYMKWLYSNAKDGDLLMSGYPRNKTLRGFRNLEFKPTMESLGIVGVTPHSTRHTCASLLVNSGVSPAIVKSIMGHANFTTTVDTYFHTNIEEIVESGNKI